MWLYGFLESRRPDNETGVAMRLCLINSRVGAFGLAASAA